MAHRTLFLENSQPKQGARCTSNVKARLPNTENALAENGLSQSSLVIKVGILALFLIALHFFMFVGFQAFTDPTDGWAALVNCGLVVILAVGMTMLIHGDGYVDVKKHH